MNRVMSLPISEADLENIISDIRKLYPEADAVSIVGTYARVDKVPSTKSHDIDLLIHFPAWIDKDIIERRYDEELWHKWYHKNIDFLRKFGDEDTKYGQHISRIEEGLPTPEIKVWKL